MPVAEFEEKEYENPTSAQLLQGSQYLWPPGQALEFTLGFDAALRVQQTAFWGLWGMTPPTGAVLNAGWWRAYRNAPAPTLPPFRLNLFVQYKRPFYVSTRSGREWSHWNCCYYRFPITPHQQAALEELSTGLGAQGLVVYASPDFHTHAELYTHIQNQHLVSRSNFVKASTLQGHGTYTYSQAGINGIACSDPKEVPSIDLLREVEQRCESQSRGPSPPEFFFGLGATLDRVMERHESEARRHFYSNRTSRIMELLQVTDGKMGNMMSGWVKAFVASSALGLDWYVGRGS